MEGTEGGRGRHDRRDLTVMAQFTDALYGKRQHETCGIFLRQLINETAPVAVRDHKVQPLGHAVRDGEDGIGLLGIEALSNLILEKVDNDIGELFPIESNHTVICRL